MVYGYTEPTYDVFEVNVKSQSGVWSNLLTLSGSFSSWTTKTIDLGSYAGQSNLTISFDFVSDSTFVPTGVAGIWIDDVLLEAY
jgi:hypothetical protein